MEDADEECDVKEPGGKYCACCTKLKASCGNFDGSSNMLVFAEIFESFLKASIIIQEKLYLLITHISHLNYITYVKRIQCTNLNYINLPLRN